MRFIVPVRRLLRACALLIILFLSILLSLPQSPVTAQGGDPILVGAGDIASSDLPGAAATAALLDNIPGTVFTAGDNVYSGVPGAYDKFYGPTWGRHKARTRPIPGNHDYAVPGAAAYFEYFGDLAGPAGKGYYSYNLGTWHIVALNSNAIKGLQDEEVKWLRADLAANPSQCVLAITHHPVFSSGAGGISYYSRAFFQVLYEFGADVIISGDAHHYERFAPSDIHSRVQPTRGIRQFVVGTGGADLNPLGPRWRNTEVRNNQTWGVLKLTLHPGSYSWEFVPVAGKTFTDQGTAPCVSN